jgi:hypothetical protein
LCRKNPCKNSNCPVFFFTRQLAPNLCLEGVNPSLVPRLQMTRIIPVGNWENYQLLQPKKGAIAQWNHDLLHPLSWNSSKFWADSRTQLLQKKARLVEGPVFKGCSKSLQEWNHYTIQKLPEETSHNFCDQKNTHKLCGLGKIESHAQDTNKNDPSSHWNVSQI